MPANYVLLEKITVGEATASSVTFSSIPQTGYTDLVVYHSARNTVNNANLRLNFNGSGGTAYSAKKIYASNTTVGSNSETSAAYIYGLSDRSTDTASTFASGSFYIPNYTSSSYKSFSYDGALEGNIAATYLYLTAGLWSNTAAITSVTLTPDSGNFVQYSTFYLYGVAALGTTPAIVPYATGGNTIMTDGTYWYHTFVSSGTFTPQKAITCDYLVVAGGGGGGYGYGAGGGAGGLRSTVTATGGGGSLESALSLTATAYTVTIGAGGTGASTVVLAPNGSNSVFATITSTGGGGGSSSLAGAGASGGSGGGGSVNGTAGGAGTSGQGYAGGTGGPYGNEGGGGGGGAGGVGATGSYSPALGVGGVGVATSISGSSVYYAGGGGGGGNGISTAAGGNGGGGSSNGNNGTANTGGGGGGNGGAGGSGIVIVRYAV